MSLYPSTFEKISEENKQLYEPSVPKGNRDKIMECYKTKGFIALDSYFINQQGSKILLAKIKAKIPLWVKKAIKK